MQIYPSFQSHSEDKNGCSKIRFNRIYFFMKSQFISSHVLRLKKKKSYSLFASAYLGTVPPLPIVRMETGSQSFMFSRFVLQSSDVEVT